MWYGSHANDHSLEIDCLWVDRDVPNRAALGAAVLQTAHEAYRLINENDPEYHLLLAPRWKEDPAICAEVEWRRAAAQNAGLISEIERLRYEWTADVGLEPSSERVFFAPEASDDVFLEAFRRVAVGSLDMETRDGIARFGLDGQARKTLECYRAMRGSREWWRMAHTAGGKLVGFTIPSANEDFPVIGYLGVVPEMRGHGYARDLLAEATRILVDQGATRIRSDTDVTNRPMAAAFERTRYRNFAVRLIFSAART